LILNEYSNFVTIMSMSSSAWKLNIKNTTKIGVILINQIKI
jgi:hypothetical protein